MAIIIRGNVIRYCILVHFFVILRYVHFIKFTLQSLIKPFRQWVSSSNLTALFKVERNTHYLEVLWQNWIKTPFKRYFKPETHWCCTEQILSYVKIKYLSYCNFDPHSWLIYEKVRSSAAAVHTSNTVHCAFLLARSNIPTYCQVLSCSCKWDIKHNGGTSLYHRHRHRQKRGWSGFAWKKLTENAIYMHLKHHLTINTVYTMILRQNHPSSILKKHNSHSTLCWLHWLYNNFLGSLMRL